LKKIRADQSYKADEQKNDAAFNQTFAQRREEWDDPTRWR
jgi:hypothetical protein